MACTTCYRDWISCGLTEIIIQSQLTPETEFTWVLTTPSGSKYSGLATTTSEGHLTIDISNVPEAMLNPYAGIFTLEVQTDGCTPAIWNDSAYCEPFSCIEFEVRNGNAEKNTLGCSCP